MRDRERDFEANRLAALARVHLIRRPRPAWQRIRRTAGWFRVMRRGATT